MRLERQCGLCSTIFRRIERRLAEEAPNGVLTCAEQNNISVAQVALMLAMEGRERRPNYENAEQNSGREWRVDENGSCAGRMNNIFSWLLSDSDLGRRQTFLQELELLC